MKLNDEEIIDTVRNIPHKAIQLDTEVIYQYERTKEREKVTPTIAMENLKRELLILGILEAIKHSKVCVL